MSDDELIAEAKKFEKNLLNFFWRQGVPLMEAEDLVQETYVRLWKYRRQYIPTAKLSTFLFLLARQVRIDALRRQTRRENREKGWGAEQETMSQRASVTSPVDSREDVRWALSRLPEISREVIELGVFQDLPYAEAAEILGIPVGTVKSRMHHALKKLKEIFNEQRS